MTDKGSVHVALGPRLAAFDPAGELPPLAASIAKAIRGSELAAVELFWGHYVATAPSELTPPSVDIETYKLSAVRNMQIMFSDLADQRWADGMHRYWVLTRGDVDAVAAVRAAYSMQYQFLANVLAQHESANVERLLVMVGALGRIAWLEGAILAQQLGEVNRRNRDIDRAHHAEVFRDHIAAGVVQASSLGSELRIRASDASAATRRMLAKASQVANAAEQSALAMRDAADTSAGLIRAIGEAQGEVEIAASVAIRASEQANAAVEVSRELSEIATSIESILQLIRTVAGQTNLLALNATIEAARAGDAGRGFAVVAQEVKSLATQTARSTDEIAGKVEAIQAATLTNVAMSRAIRETVAEVQTSATRLREVMASQAQTVTAITAAVDETAMAANEMSTTIASILRDTEGVAIEIDALEVGFNDVNRNLTDLQGAAASYVQLVS